MNHQSNSKIPENVTDLEFYRTSDSEDMMWAVSRSVDRVLLVIKFLNCNAYLVFPVNGDLDINITAEILRAHQQSYNLGWPRSGLTEDEANQLIFKYAHPHLWMI
jgi:hypothetical protein